MGKRLDKFDAKQVLKTSAQRRHKHLMIQLLRSFEEIFAPLQSGREAGIFKVGIRNAVNEASRASGDELDEYDIIHRPIRLTDDNILSVTRLFMESIEGVEFIEEPFGIRVTASKGNARQLEALRSEIGIGIVYMKDDHAIYEAVGTEACVDHIIPVFDKYRLVNRSSYLQWRQKVQGVYLGARHANV